MSDPATMVDRPTRSKTPTNTASPAPALEISGNEVPKLEMPAQAKDNYERMKAASEDMAGVVEAAFATASKGATEYGLKVMDVTRANTTAAFDFVGKLMSVKSPSEAVELATAHARQQFDTASQQNRELLALARKVAVEAIEPIKTGMTRAFERKA